MEWNLCSINYSLTISNYWRHFSTGSMCNLKRWLFPVLWAICGLFLKVSNGDDNDCWSPVVGSLSTIIKLRGRWRKYWEQYQVSCALIAVFPVFSMSLNFVCKHAMIAVSCFDFMENPYNSMEKTRLPLFSIKELFFSYSKLKPNIYSEVQIRSKLNIEDHVV